MAARPSGGIEEAAGKLAPLPREEHADLLLSYDQESINGHRDYVRVHRVCVRRYAAQKRVALKAHRTPVPSAGRGRERSAR